MGTESRLEDKERLVILRPRTIVMVAGVLVGLAAALWVVWIARKVITWVLVAIFLALAIDPAVRWVQSRGVRRRGLAAGLVYVIVLLCIGGLAAVFIPVLVEQVNDFIDAVPGY